MTNKQLEHRLADAAQSLTTDLPFERIAQAIPVVSGTPVTYLPRRRRPWLVVAAACIVAVLAVGGVWHHLASSAPTHPTTPPVTVPSVVVADSAIIDIDVNPSVEIAVDTADRISAVTAVNQDARQVLDNLDLTKQPLAEGVQMLFDALVTHGYVSGVNNPVLVTVQSSNDVEANRLHAMVNSGVDAAMEQHSLSASVVNQTVSAFDEVTQFAQKHGISNGKAAFVLSLVEQQPTLNADELVDYAFSTLAAIAQHHNIPLSELVDYDAEGSLWQSILDAHVLEFTDEDAMRWGGILSVSEVKDLALKAMPNDYIADNALLIHVDMVIGDDQLLYRVELVSLGYLYEYVIDADDGTFQKPVGTTSPSTTSADRETVRSTLHGGGTRVPVELPDEKDTKTTTTSSSTTTTTVTAIHPTDPEDTLTEEKAKAIVFFRLGITEAEARDLSVGRHPTSNEMSVYLGYDGHIYVFYMDITTEDVTKVVIAPTNIAIGDFRINEWDALAIALTHAKMTETECGEITILYYVNNDAPFIDVAWTADNTVYHYRIDGVDGSVALSTTAGMP